MGNKNAKTNSKGVILVSMLLILREFCWLLNIVDFNQTYELGKIKYMTFTEIRYEVHCHHSQVFIVTWTQIT